MEIQLAEPLTTPESAAWLTACSRRELRFGFCGACNRAHFYPRQHCPHCHADGARLEQSAGRGTIYAWTRVQAKPAPYDLAYVRADEGFTLLTQLAGEAPAGGWDVGTRVLADWHTTAGGQALPVFRAAGE
jgi:uncharacterized OB-fold protein